MSQVNLDTIVKVGERIRSERKRLGHNQTEFAALAGIELATQSRYETAKQRPKLDYLFAIASVGADTQFILTGRRNLGDALTTQEITVLDYFRDASASTKTAVSHLLSVAVKGSSHEPPIVELPSEDALARMFRAMLLPLNLGDALEDTARTFAQQLPASLETAAPVHQPPGRGEVPDHDVPVPAPATGRPASGQEPRT